MAEICAKYKDPTSDVITVLIENIASQIDYLCEGMMFSINTVITIGGTWLDSVGSSRRASCYGEIQETKLLVSRQIGYCRSKLLDHCRRLIYLLFPPLGTSTKVCIFS